MAGVRFLQPRNLDAGTCHFDAVPEALKAQKAVWRLAGQVPPNTTRLALKYCPVFVLFLPSFFLSFFFFCFSCFCLLGFFLLSTNQATPFLLLFLGGASCFSSPGGSSGSRTHPGGGRKRRKEVEPKENRISPCLTSSQEPPNRSMDRLFLGVDSPFFSTIVLLKNPIAVSTGVVHRLREGFFEGQNVEVDTCNQVSQQEFYWTRNGIMGISVRIFFLRLSIVGVHG